MAQQETASTSFPEFAWGSGEECSDPLVHFEGKRVRVDEMESTGHLARLEDDIADAAGLGIHVWRYGIPWRRTERDPGVYDWSLWDRALQACSRVGLQPIADLCHFGLPDHYPGFASAEWTEGFLRYLDAFLERYPGVRCFTLINEPWSVAMQSGCAGVWNDGQVGYENYARILGNCILAELEGHARIRARGALNVGAELFLVPVVADPTVESTAGEFHAFWRATWDLRFGHSLDQRTVAAFAAVDERVLTRIAELTTTEGLIAGHDFYPTSAPVFGKRPELSLSECLDAYVAAATEWYQRYEVPFWVAETSNLGLPVESGSAWIEGLASRIAGMRRNGIPVRGLCWYSRGDQHDWHTSLTRPVGEVTEVGLFDIRRRRRPVADTFRALCAAGPPS